MSRNVSKAVIIVSLIAIALVSFFPVAARYSDPARYTDYTASIDDKTETVLKLMAVSTLTSTGITAIPGDTATPIAEKLADFSEYFLLILCVLYAEKYLLTIIPYGVFRGLVPIVCLLFAAGRLWNPALMDRQGRKLLLVGLALLLVIPLSVRTSDMIYATYQESIDSTIASAEALTGEAEQLTEAEETGVFTKIKGLLTETKDSLVDKASTVLNRFVETLAVMIVTSCLIPILVLLFFVWVIKQLTGVDLGGYMPKRGHRRPGEALGEDQRQRSSI